MGDIADMMIDGTLCQQCGCVFDDMQPTAAEIAKGKRERRLPVAHAEPPGHPRTCEYCQGAEAKGRQG